MAKELGIKPDCEVVFALKRKKPVIDNGEYGRSIFKKVWYDCVYYQQTRDERVLVAEFENFEKETDRKIDIFLKKTLDLLPQAKDLYYRLILLVGPAKSGKTRLLMVLSEKISSPVINLNLELSERLLKIAEPQRVLYLPNLLEEICAQVQGDTVLLDNTELLFEPVLKHDPLRLLQGLSRKRTVVASWNGNIQGQYLFYAHPEHPSFRRYLLTPGELLIISFHGEVQP